MDAQTALLQKYTIPFAICFGLTLIFSVLRDDDVVYKFLDRKPTGQEAIARIRFVLAKLFASLYGGALMAVFLERSILKNALSLNISQNSAVLFAIFCIFISCMLIGVMQNIVRYIQGRQQRPLIDSIIWKHNLKQWFRQRH